MKIYAATFKGFYPVGASAVVIAKSPKHATDILTVELKRRGLTGDGIELKLIRTDQPLAHVITDGNY